MYEARFSLVCEGQTFKKNHLKKDLIQGLNQC